MYRLVTKRTAKTSLRKREREFFFQTQTTRRAFVYSALLTMKCVEALAIADYRSPRNATRSRNGNRP